jgi:spore maturation protein CgeB
MQLEFNMSISESQSFELNNKKIFRAWRVPGRIIFIGDSQNQEFKKLIEDISPGIWGSNFSGVFFNFLKKSSLGVSQSVFQGVKNSIKFFDINLIKSGDENNNFLVNTELKHLLNIYKPSLIIVAAEKQITNYVMYAATELELPIISADSNESDAIRYLQTNDNCQINLATFSLKSENLRKELSTLVSKLLSSKRHIYDSEYDLRDLRVATVMDEFTYKSYLPECNLYQLSVQDPINKLEQIKPDLLFIESAWRGLNNEWERKIGFPSVELIEIIQWCKERFIPTIFWNKEDPIHFETFITTATLFDYVFTTDLDCIGMYKSALGHDRVYFLPFACQPKNQNPLEKYPRKDIFSFAGGYYLRYPERIKDLESYIEFLPNYRPLEIFDRNYGKEDTNYKFPEKFEPFIVGTLPFDEIDKAYKGYNYAINLNSIKQSQSMFARRVFDLVASNTTVVSNYSRGMRLLFGDLIFSSDSGRQIVEKLAEVDKESNRLKKIKLAGLRKVLQEHTYEERLRYIASKTLKKVYKSDSNNILIIALVKNKDHLRNIVDNYSSQLYENKKLIIVFDNIFIYDQSLLKNIDIKIYLKNDAKILTLSSLGFDGSWIGGFSPNDYYGRNYLIDLVMARKYSNALAVGKKTINCIEFNQPVLKNINHEYSFVQEISFRSGIGSRNILNGDINLYDFAIGIDTESFINEKLFSIDQFNYLKNLYLNVEYEHHKSYVNDIDIDVGIPLGKIYQITEKIPQSPKIEKKCLSLGAEQLSKLFNKTGSKNISINSSEFGINLSSNLDEDIHEYIYAKEAIDINIFPDKSLDLHLEVSPGLNIELIILFKDDKSRISHELKKSNINYTIIIPQNAKYLHLGLRVMGPGKAALYKLLWGHKEKQLPIILTSKKNLVITNVYPSYENLYRNGFIHSRVRNYTDEGLKTEIFLLRESGTINFSEFENIDVISGNAQNLKILINSGEINCLMVHFLDQSIWNVIKEFIGKVRILIWIHGSEVQPWYRRDFNYESEDERQAAKNKSDVRMIFWREVFSSQLKGIKFIFVSQYFANEVMQDIGIKLPDVLYEIIHNPIDTKIFNYTKKSINHRKKLLSIRPYHSRKYANDLTVQAIIELSKEDFFDELEILLIGDGPLFEDTLKPLIDFKNVKIQKRFVQQKEISALHKEYGIFICPTRMDSQGVSKDEAMSSGMVVISNHNTAIPEFIDDSSGILVAEEDYAGIAQAIKILFKNPNKFISLSEGAAKRVRAQTCSSIVIKKELNLIINTGEN